MLNSRDLIILSSSIGDLLGDSRLPQGATGCPTFCARMSPPPPWAHFWPKNHNKNHAETKGLEGRPKGRKRVAWTPIRSCLCSPNAFSHFPQELKISSKMCSLWVPISLILGTFFEAFSNKWPKGSRAPPQSGKKIRKWTPRVPKCSPRVPNWSLKVTPPRPLAPQIGAPAGTGVPNSSFDRHPSIQASKHPGLRSERSAAEAVAYKYIYIYIYIYVAYCLLVFPIPGPSIPLK